MSPTREEVVKWFEQEASARRLDADRYFEEGRPTLARSLLNTAQKFQVAADLFSNRRIGYPTTSPSPAFCLRTP